MALSAEGTSKSVNAGGLKFHYHEAGPSSGPVLMLLHGGGPGAGAWANFSKNIDFFARKYRVLMPDSPGFAGSDKPTIEGPLFKFMADSHRKFMDALGVKRAHFVGNSMGGGTSMRIALDEPGRVDRLVVMGPGGSLPVFTPFPPEGIKHIFGFYEGEGPTREKLNRWIDYMVYDRSMVTEELLNRRFEAATQPELIAKPVLSPRSKAVLEPLWKEFDKITQKTLVVWGRDDQTVMLDNAWIMMKMIPDVRVHIFGKTGHWAQWERPAEFNKLVDGFLSDD